MDMIMIKDLLV